MQLALVTSVPFTPQKEKITRSMLLRLWNHIIKLLQNKPNFFQKWIIPMSSNSSNFNKINSNQNLFSNVLASIPYNSINLTRMDSDKNKLNASYFKLLLVLLTFIPLESFIGISNPKIFSSIKIMLWLKL